MPGTATSVFEEGLAVPPIRIYAKESATTKPSRSSAANTRLPEIYRPTLDSEIQACIMGAKAHGRALPALRAPRPWKPAFQAIIEKCRNTFRDELLPKIADGEYTWHDYVERDMGGETKLHKIVLKLTKRADKITLDFTGTDPQSDGPLNWAGGLRGWRLPDQMDCAHPAQSRGHPERAAEINVNEGVCESLM
jgi:N-methylhydantoinase B